MAAALKGVLQESLAENVQNSKILVVGAGGIGCEVLKNLVLTGFKTIEVVIHSSQIWCDYYTCPESAFVFSCLHKDHMKQCAQVH